MNFNNYHVVILANLVLAAALGTVIIALSFLNIRDSITEWLRRKLYREWNRQIHRYFTLPSGFEKTFIFPRAWFNAFMLPYFQNFKGPIRKRLTDIYLSAGMRPWLFRQLRSRSEGRRIMALLTFIYGDIPIKGRAEFDFTGQIVEKETIETALLYRIIARMWPEDYGSFIMEKLMNSDFYSENMKAEIIREMRPWFIEHFNELWEKASVQKLQMQRCFLADMAVLLKFSDAVPLLREMFQQGDSEERIAAMKALGTLGCVEEKEAIRHLFETERRAVLQTLAFKAFLKLTDEQDIDYIAGQLSHANWFVRYSAAKNLTRRKGKEGFAVLLKHSSKDCAALALSESGRQLTENGWGHAAC